MSKGTKKHSLKLASHEILRKTYVDDFALGRDGVRDILKLQQSTSELMQQAGFNLTKWSSNLSLAEKMFDPIGLITLFAVRSKLLL